MENDDYRWGQQQAENGVARNPWAGRMSRDEIRGYMDEMDRQQRQCEQQKTLWRERQEALWRAPAADGKGGDGCGLIELAILGYFAVFAVLIVMALVAELIIQFWKTVLVVVLVSATVLTLILIPAETRGRALHRVAHKLGQGWSLSLEVRRRLARHLRRVRRHGLARWRGRPLPGVERVGRR